MIDYNITTYPLRTNLDLDVSYNIKNCLEYIPISLSFILMVSKTRQTTHFFDGHTSCDNLGGLVLDNLSAL